jgi:hypothetical protein
MSALTYVQILERLGTIESELGNRAADGDEAAQSYYDTKRDFELAWAQKYMQVQGTVEERKQKTIQALWKSDDYVKYVKAQGDYEGWKAATRVLETRASILQSLLKAVTAEAKQTGPQPQWSAQVKDQHFGARSGA